MPSSGGIGGGLLDFIWGDSPEAKMQDLARQQQARDRSATGLDPNGNPYPPGYPYEPTQPSPNVLPAGQTPNAMKLPDTTASLIIDLQQRQAAAAGINQALGVGFAAASQPRDREMVSKMFNVNQPDPIKTEEAMQNAMGFQSGQDRLDALGQMIQGPQGLVIAQSLNMPGGTPEEKRTNLFAAYRSDPQGVNKMIQATQAPTSDIANLDQINRWKTANPNASSAQIADLTAMITSKVAGTDAAPIAAAQEAYRVKHGGNTDYPWTPNDPRSFAQYAANEKQKEDDRGVASRDLDSIQRTTGDFRNDLEQLKVMPGLKTILDTPGRSEIARQALASVQASPGIDPVTIISRYALSAPEKDAVAKLAKIGGETMGSAFHSIMGTGSRITQTEIGPLANAISTTQNLNQDYAHYVHNAIIPAITRSKRVLAAAIASTGNMHSLPPELAPWVPAQFRVKGDLYKEGGGAENLPDLTPPTPEQIAAAKEKILKNPERKQNLLDALQEENVDVEKLRYSNPKNW